LSLIVHSCLTLWHNVKVRATPTLRSAKFVNSGLTACVGLKVDARRPPSTCLHRLRRGSDRRELGADERRADPKGIGRQNTGGELRRAYRQTAKKMTGAAASTPSGQQIARMERELAALQTQVKSVEETYGIDNLHLTVARGYVAKLLANARITPVAFVSPPRISWGVSENR
jgi:hypothetical protein